MRKINKIMIMVLVLVFCFGSASAQALTIVGDTANSTENLGDFSALVTYSFSSSTDATLTIAMQNTSPPANGGYITAFVFNDPDTVSAVAFSSTSPSFKFLFDAGKVKAAPFGDFDFLVTNDPTPNANNSFEGGGQPTTGIDVGGTETFTFNFTGIGLDLLTAKSFVTTPNTDGWSFVVRFKGFENDGSDKVPGVVVAPIPGSLLLLGSGLLGLIGIRRKLS